MYAYDAQDKSVLQARVAEFSNQVHRRLQGTLTEDEFRPLRLMNGLYLQLHAYMLRVAIPYGTLRSGQLRGLARIADRYDRGYGHFTTRQNIQFNWPRLVDVPAILSELADLEMHALQTSGNCIRNISSDAFAGVAADEIADPRHTAEWLRQWSTLHPEFSFLPRKFKIAVIASAQDRAAMRFHDLGLRLVRGDSGSGEDASPAYEIWIGGGLGRTPFRSHLLYPSVPLERLLPTLEAVMRTYNYFGRRDNKYKARIKILVHELGIEAFRQKLESFLAEYQDPHLELYLAEYRRLGAYFRPAALPSRSPGNFRDKLGQDAAFARFVETNLSPHRDSGYGVLSVSLKPPGGVPGNMTSAQMRQFADLADRYSFGELRVTHRQNLVLPSVALAELWALWHELGSIGLATPNIGTATDIIACPGMDYCNLATARSIPIGQAVSERIASRPDGFVFKDMSINISGCINACAHHHVGTIGILGLEKAGKEFYQLTLGGDATETPQLGTRLGPGFAADEVPEVVSFLLDLYKQWRLPDETFRETVRRLGAKPFGDRLYEHLKGLKEMPSETPGETPGETLGSAAPSGLAPSGVLSSATKTPELVT